MANKKYVVELSRDERAHLGAMISKGICSAQANLKARILLKADQGADGESLCDTAICEALNSNVRMVERVRQKFVLEGFEAVFKRKRRQTPPRQPIFDGEAEARLIALACTEPPQGYARWSIRLLADKVVELGIVETAHHNTIARTLKKTNLNRIAANTG
jgi:Homeodomain-like domain